MSYYESSSSSNNGQWPTQNTWDHQVPPIRSGECDTVGSHIQCPIPDPTSARHQRTEFARRVRLLLPVRRYAPALPRLCQCPARDSPSSRHVALSIAISGVRLGVVHVLTPSEEVDRAFDNLSKSGKAYGAAGRRESQYPFFIQPFRSARQCMPGERRQLGPGAI